MGEEICFYGWLYGSITEVADTFFIPLSKLKVDNKKLDFTNEIAGEFIERLECLLLFLLLKGKRKC